MSITVSPGTGSNDVTNALSRIDNTSAGAELIQALGLSQTNYTIAFQTDPGYLGSYDSSSHTIYLDPSFIGNSNGITEDLAHELGHAIQDQDLGQVTLDNGATVSGSAALFGSTFADAGITSAELGINPSSNAEENYGELFAEETQLAIDQQAGINFVGPAWNADGSLQTAAQFQATVNQLNVILEQEYPSLSPQTWDAYAGGTDDQNAAKNTENSAKSGGTAASSQLEAAFAADVSSSDGDDLLGGIIYSSQAVSELDSGDTVTISDAGPFVTNGSRVRPAGE
jgi:hypothetical protein